MTTSESFKKTVGIVNLNRRLGDALKEAGNARDALKKFQAALEALDHELEEGTSSRADKAELYGMRGGLLRRMDRPADALASYQQGASIEKDDALATTYNRSNSIKLGLIAGSKTLDDYQLDLHDLARAIEQTIREDEGAASDAWMYADLGDTLLLLGDVPRAIDAYRTFSERARSDSPTTTLTVLHQIGKALETRGDARAERFLSDLLHVEGVLALSS